MGNFLKSKSRLFWINERNLSVIIFSLFSAWLISFPYEGQILYALTQRFQINVHVMNMGAIVCHIAGLFLCGFYVKSMKAARFMMIISAAVCITGSSIFFFYPSVVWNITLFAMSYFAGNWMAAWGYFLKLCVPKYERTQTIGSVLIYSALFMILINLITIYVSIYIGLSISVLFLLIAFYFSFKLPSYKPETAEFISDEKTVKAAKPLAFLCIFIIILTVNSGLMFQFVSPAFEHLKWLTIFYWAIPYIAAVFFVKKLPQVFNRAYILYIAIAMIGLSFIAFMGLDRSALSYLFINTMMLGAFGIYDLFWWSILGAMLDMHINPAKILGIGLTANVSGVLLGELIVSIGFNNIGSNEISLIALSVVFITLAILPPLHKYLSDALSNHEFFAGSSEIKQTVPPRGSVEQHLHYGELTERECQIVQLLLQGRTYKMIAHELYLSENTVKTHIKNIYSKLAVKNKSELIQKLSCDMDIVK